VAGSVIVVKKKDRFDRLVMIGMVVDYRSQQKVKLRFERLGMVRMIVDYVVVVVPCAFRFGMQGVKSGGLGMLRRR
jgi:hypothetical protein